jgi:hypothetical protein
MVLFLAWTSFGNIGSYKRMELFLDRRKKEKKIYTSKIKKGWRCSNSYITLSIFFNDNVIVWSLR